MSVGTSHYDVNDTIVAVASGDAAAMRGIVRMTGPQTVTVVQQVFKIATTDAEQGNCFHQTGARRYRGQVSVSAMGAMIDWPAELWLWPTDKTYTGQPSAEFHLLGSPAVLQSLMMACCKRGTRLAGPGEFTMRAFLAGRMDLVQAEAVLDVIHAQGTDQLKTGLSQLAGGLSHPLQKVRDLLVHLLAHLEAGLDFAEEDIEFISVQELTSQLDAIARQIAQTLKQLQTRSSLQNLPQVLLVGAPNAGKSSLYNRLTESENAIVSDVRGTTRDFLRCHVQLDDVDFELVDTAGLEEALQGKTALSSEGSEPTKDAAVYIDQISQQASLERLQHADLVLLCFDGTERSEVEKWQHSLAGLPVMIVLTKNDLGDQVVDFDEKSLASWVKTVASVSVVSGIGIDDLRHEIAECVKASQQQRRETTGSMGWRAITQLEAVQDYISVALEHAALGGGEELVAAELRGAIDELGKLVGTIYTDDLLDSIFSRFCIGK